MFFFGVCNVDELTAILLNFLTDPKDVVYRVEIEVVYDKKKWRKKVRIKTKL